MLALSEAAEFMSPPLRLLPERLDQQTQKRTACTVLTLTERLVPPDRKKRADSLLSKYGQTMERSWRKTLGADHILGVVGVSTVVMVVRSKQDTPDQILLPPSSLRSLSAQIPSFRPVVNTTASLSESMDVLDGGIAHRRHLNRELRVHNNYG